MDPKNTDGPVFHTPSPAQANPLKIALIILPVVVVVVGFVIFIFFQNNRHSKSPASASASSPVSVSANPSPTPFVSPHVSPGWTAFLHPQNKYTFNYPSSFILTAYTDISFPAYKLESQPDQTLLNIDEIPYSDGAENFADDAYSYERDNKTLSITVSPVKITMFSNRQAYYFDITNAAVTREIFVGLDENTVLQIKIYSLTDTTTNQILSSFLFNDQITDSDKQISWKNYGNSLFSFQFPPGWTVSNIKSVPAINNFHYLVALKVDGYAYASESATLSVNYWDNPDSLDIPAFQAQLNKSGNQSVKIYSPDYSQTSIGQADGYFTKKGNCESVKCESYTVAFGNKVYVFNLFLPSSDLYRQDIDQILSTFTFRQ
jgi:hypothetical protein